MAMTIDDDQIEIIQEFITESRDMIEQLEPQIIELEQESDPEIMNAIFRLFHSMKGSAGFLEFTNMTRVAHAAESLLDLIRNGEITLTSTHVNLLCSACDFAKEALVTVEENYVDDAMEAAAELMTEQLAQAIDPTQDNTDTNQTEGIDPTQEEDANDTLPQLEINDEMRQSFITEGAELLQKAEQGLLAWDKNANNPEALAELFRNIHSFKGNCGFFDFSDMEQIAHQIETVLDRYKSGSSLVSDNPADTLLAALDLLQNALNEISEGRAGVIPNLGEQLTNLQQLVTPMLGEILIEEGVPAEHVTAAVETQKKPVGEILIDQGLASSEQVSAALQKQQATQRIQKKQIKKPEPRTGTKTKRQDIRVELGKLDNLINLIGEMVIAENMLVNNPDLKGLELENFNKAGQHMSKLVRELQEMAMTIRMIPVSGLFRRMIRLVHDISGKAGKKVDLVMIGEETEIDKTVIETITDPLVHLLRNSLDHGLEPPAERLATGKDEKGTVTLSARHEEGEVWVTVEDNGRGLNREKILKKAISKGLIEGDGSDLSDKEIYNMIFLPGFSTAEKVTDISGRGVGMDVVKKNLEKIKGKIDVNSVPGQGSRIDLRIPLTLAIIDGMLVRVGDTTAILPTLTILEAFRPEDTQITRTPEGDELARVRDNFYPILRLHEILEVKPDSPDLHDGILLVLEHQEDRFCLFVDEIVGQQQTVIKGLSNFIGTVSGVSGCTILGDGDVSLILDIGSLRESVENKVPEHETFAEQE